MDISAEVTSKADINNDWLLSGHAKSGANCSACHMSVDGKTNDRQWTNKPDHRACESCHDTEVKHFQQGKHGMRLRARVSFAMQCNDTHTCGTVGAVQTHTDTIVWLNWTRLPPPRARFRWHAVQSQVGLG